MIAAAVRLLFKQLITFILVLILSFTCLQYGYMMLCQVLIKTKKVKVRNIIKKQGEFKCNIIIPVRSFG